MSCNDTGPYRRRERFVVAGTGVLVVAMMFAVVTNVVMAAPKGSRDFHETGENRAFVMVEANDVWQPDGFTDPLIVRAVPVEKGPAIDGRTNDAAWDGVVELTVPLAWGGVREASLKAVYTKEDIFIAVSWPDPTRDEQHHPWVWDAGQGRYTEGAQVEDALLVSIEGGCDWNPSLLANQIHDFDGWLWLAARSNPLGQAVDVDGSVQDRRVPGLGYVKYQSRYPEPAWNIKFVDRRPDILTQPWQGLARMYKRTEPLREIYVRYQPDGRPPPVFAERIQAPSQPAGMTNGASEWAFHKTAVETPQVTVPQYRPLRLTGDAGDVAAGGRWADGRWTVEFRRALATTARTSSDSVFQRTTQFSIHVFDHTDRADEASESGRLFVEFEAAGNR